MNIQDEAMKIHSQYGTSEMANYKLQLLTEQYAKEYHESEVKKLRLFSVSQQRELLIAFCNFLFTEMKYTTETDYTPEEQVYVYLESNL